MSFAFWLGHVLRAATACTFSTAQSVPRLKCSVHFDSVHFDLEMCFAPQRRAIFHLSSGQLALFDPPEPQIFGKTQCFATFLAFRAPGSSFFWGFLLHLNLLSSETFSFFSFLLFSSLTLPISAFHLSILSEVWLLNFLRLAVDFLPMDSGNGGSQKTIGVLSGRITWMIWGIVYPCISHFRKLPYGDLIWFIKWSWWFGTFFSFLYIYIYIHTRIYVYIYIYIYIGTLGKIFPTDFHIFQRGWNHQPVMGNNTI